MYVCFTIHNRVPISPHAEDNSFTNGINQCEEASVDDDEMKVLRNLRKKPLWNPQCNEKGMVPTDLRNLV